MTTLKYREYEYQIEMIIHNFEYSAIDAEQARTEVREISHAAKSYYRQRAKEIDRNERKVNRYVDRVERYAY